MLNPVARAAGSLNPGGLDPEHVVRHGDTLASIAEAAGVSPAALLAINPQVTAPGRIGPGDRLWLPRPGEPDDVAQAGLPGLDAALAALTAPAQPEPEPAQTFADITVRRGEPLWDITKRHHRSALASIEAAAHLTAAAAPGLAPTRPSDFTEAPSSAPTDDDSTL